MSSTLLRINLCSLIVVPVLGRKSELRRAGPLPTQFAKLFQTHCGHLGSPKVSQNVLLVEDDMFLRAVMVEAVAILGYQVTECPSADQALIALQGAMPFCLVVSDVRMPGRLDGLDLARAIWSQWPELPVILMSGDTVLPLESLPSKARFLPKPVDLDALHNAITELLA
nr:response regulator [Pseudomonas sp. 14A]